MALVIFIIVTQGEVDGDRELQIPSRVVRRRIKLSDWNESRELPATHDRIQKESAKKTPKTQRFISSCLHGDNFLRLVQIARNAYSRLRSKSLIPAYAC